MNDEVWSRGYAEHTPTPVLDYPEDIDPPPHYQDLVLPSPPSGALHTYAQLLSLYPSAQAWARMCGQTFFWGWRS